MDCIIMFLFNHTLMASLLTGWILDLLFGDPLCLPHPVVYMGKWIARGERRLNRGKHRKAKGAVFAVVSILLVFLAATVLFGWLRLCSIDKLHGANWRFVLLSYTVMSLLVFFCLAGKTLRREVKMVFQALQRSLDDGRRQVARIVGRDTQRLSHQEVATAALETLAENLSDGVIAPLFWFCLLGVPGMLTYKMINTFDSMIGYQNKRYKDFGCWAAHIDDIANFIPARITAILIIVAGWIYTKVSSCLPRKSFLFCLKNTLRYSRQHASPNSGWPEAALATLLDCRFGGPHDYFGELFPKPYIGNNPRPITFLDMQTSIRICLTAEIAAVVIVVATTLV